MSKLSAGLDFTIGRFPVRVHWSFFILALLIGMGSGSLLTVVTWMLVVFVSILVHELGHAIVAEKYGMFPSIMLHSMGGLTMFSRAQNLTHKQEIILSLAGPFTGFLLAAAVYALSNLVPSTAPRLVGAIFGQLIWVNLGWGVINLIPMLPLDGGQVMRSLWQWLRSPYDERTPLMISVAVGVIGVAICLWFRLTWMALLAAWFTYNNYMKLRGINPPMAY